MEEEMVEILLGKFVLTVDKDTAQKILHDDVFAQQYLEQLTEMEDSQKNNVPSSIPLISPKVQNEKKLSIGEFINRNKVWTTSRIQTETDKAATLYFLAMRKKLNHKFSDKCTAKNSLWVQIAQSMNEAGFFVGGVEGREKCHQKFVNLQSSYIKYKDKKRSTGEGKIEKPPFYEEIDEILGKKDKANPTFLIDSLNVKKTPLQECSNSMDACGEDTKNSIPSTSKSQFSTPQCLPSTSKSTTSPESAIFNPQIKTPTSTTVNRFKNCVKTVTPKKNQIMENFYTLAKKSEERQEMEFQTVIELIREESQKRHEQVMALISALNKNKNNQSKKRKRDSSESDD